MLDYTDRLLQGNDWLDGCMEEKDVVYLDSSKAFNLSLIASSQSNC